MLFSEQPVGFVGERKAVALLVLAFYAAFFGLMALLSANPDLPELHPWWAFWFALFSYYGMGFFALAADWFWARWFVIGLGYSGLTLTGWVVLMERTLPGVLAFYGFTHGLMALMLQGEKMVAAFDAKPGWRERLNLDENGVRRVGQTVTRGTASLLTLIMVALIPRQEPEGLAVLAAAGLGLYGVLRLRTWGILLLGGAALGGTALALGHGTFAMVPYLGFMQGISGVAALFLVLAVLPFARPILRHVRS